MIPSCYHEDQIALKVCNPINSDTVRGHIIPEELWQYNVADTMGPCITRPSAAMVLFIVKFLI